MADPLSIIGTAAGLVSLGLQVYGGIKDYLDAIQTSQEDIAGIHRHAVGLKDSLDAIEGVIRTRSLNSPASADVAMSCLLSCHAELNALSGVLAELISSPSTSSTNALRTKISEGKRKLTYPFKRSNIVKLEDRLRNANLTLHTALHALGINLLANLSDAVSHHGIQSDTVAAGVMLLCSEATGINASIHTVNQSLPTIMEGVQALGPLIKNESRNISSQMQRDGRTLNQNISHLENQMGASFLSQTSQLERIEAHLANRLQDERLRRVEEIMAGLELTDPPGRHHDSATRHLGRLVAKPDSLKTLCDEFTTRKPVTMPYHPGPIRTENFEVRGRERVQTGCSCGFIRNYKRRYTRWGSLLLYHEEDGRAIPFCDCESPEFVQPESSRTFGATYFGSLLKRAIGITLSMRHGAGGASLSAQLGYYNILNPETAPAFKLMMLLDNAISSRKSSISVGDIGRLLEECSFRIRHLYQTGNAGPKDLNPFGETVLHRASFLARPLRIWKSPATYKFLRYFILDLLNYGVPAGVCDFHGRTPLVEGLTFVDNDSSRQECVAIYDLLFTEGSDLPIVDFTQAEQLLKFIRRGMLETIMRSSLPTAQVLGCNSLSIAVLLRNVGETERIIDAEPSLCFEKNAFDMTPIHLAANWPDGLKKLLNRSGGLQRVAVSSVGFPTPLICSSSQNSSFCREGGNPTFCSNCACFECTEIILRYDCSLRVEDLRKAMYLASHRTKLKLFEHLKNRRIRLQYFALEKLSPEDCKLLGLSPGQIPDARANEIVRKLQQKGWKIPEPLQIGTEKAPRPTMEPSYWGSVYHLIDCTATADMLLALGFKDFDSMDTKGRTPLSTASSVEYALWLIDHGANVVSPLGNIGSKLNQTAVHTFAHQFGYYLSGSWGGRGSWGKLAGEARAARKRLVDLTCNMDAPDNCRCACSPQGCTPFTGILKSALEAGYAYSPISRRARLTKLQKDFNRTTQALPLDVFGLPKIPLASLRFLTFEALGVRHTCCYCDCELRQSSPFGNAYDDEDLQELREEDSSLVEILEELMQEFETRYYTSDENLLQFVERYWTHREEVLEDMDGCKLSDEQKRKLEEIGVNLYDEMEEMPEVEEIQMEEGKDLNYWIRRMDQIVAE